VERLAVPVVAVCAGLQVAGVALDDPDGVEGPAGSADGLGWLPVTSTFEGPKVLDRPTGQAVADPASGQRVAGYRIHHGRVRPVADDLDPWLVADDGTVLGWRRDRVCGTTLHGLFEDDGFRTAILAWVADAAGKRWSAGGVSFAGARLARLDAIADALAAHLDLDRLAPIVTAGAVTREDARL
jgi:adenosylcobyric acid synthase